LRVKFPHDNKGEKERQGTMSLKADLLQILHNKGLPLGFLVSLKELGSKELAWGFGGHLLCTCSSKENNPGKIFETNFITARKAKF